MALTSGEFDLLCAFAQHPGRVLSRDFLLEQTRGREAGPFDRTIDVQVGRLRKKLEADADDPQIIKSVRGAGYILVPPVTAAEHGVHACADAALPPGIDERTVFRSLFAAYPDALLLVDARGRDRAGQPGGRAAARLRASTSWSA